jgi:hypothetical protein
MGLFQRSSTQARNTGEVGRFTSPHSLQDTLEVAYKGLAGQLTVPEFKASTAQPTGAIFVSRLEADSITVTAGNSVETYFEFRIDLTPAPHGCEGRAYFDRPEKQIRRWVGNTIGLNYGVLMALEAASVRIDSWRTG